jgi:RNA recognition motif-containing protein
MDALADLASMQQQQQAARQSAGGLRDPQLYQAQRPSISLQNIPRSLSGNSVGDISMADASQQPRTFSSAALDEASVEELKQLDQALKDNPFDYESHTRFITLLHQGLHHHMFPGDGTIRDGNSYELLADLREAYHAMDKIYPLGETLSEYWINDEKVLAHDIESRLAIEQYCQKALKDHPKSVRLWVLYGEYMEFCHSCAFDAEPPERWADEDREVGREIFTTEVVLDVWKRGSEATMHNPKDSHCVWDRYAQLLLDDLQRNYSTEKARSISLLFEDRLSKPHATWDQTFQMFSTFNSQYYAASYEEIMEVTGKRTSNAKKLYNLRVKYEFRLDKALQDQDRYTEHDVYIQYLKWEKRSAGPFSFQLVASLFERALLRFPADATIWEEYVEFLITKSDPSVSVLEVLDRATRHCPWSGSLWSHRILTLEAENRDFNEIESVKHNATETGLLEHSGLEELLKVQIAWCGYLRRKAFENPNASDDDVDIAEVGIRSALDDVRESGVKKYGDAYQGDPQYRLERIHIKFFTQNGNVEGARAIWKSLIPQQKDSYEFWYRFYIWEMVVWAKDAVRDPNRPGQLKTPSNATEVLEEGMKSAETMDYPEQLIQMFINHCEQHESVLRLRSALIEARKLSLFIQRRRASELEQATLAATHAQQAAAGDNQEAQEEATAVPKRKRDEAIDDDYAPKKSRQVDVQPTTEISPPAENPAQEADDEASRDREHSVVIIKKLPPGTTQTRVRKFFSDCGKVQTVLLKEEPGSVTAAVEFKTQTEAQYALLKEAKGFEGKQIEISMGASTSLFVTNYKDDADEAYIRNLFAPYGEILDIRFPSLRFGATRRFCYVQFSNAAEANAATQLDGKVIDGLPLNAKISNPSMAKDRGGATAEGREIYIWHLNFNWKKSVIQEHFSKFGQIEKLKFPMRANGTNKGFAFLAYKTKESAQAAIKEMNGTEIFAWKINVEPAKIDARPKEHVTVRLDKDPTPPENANKFADSAPSNDPSHHYEVPPQSFRHRHIALLHIPDTVKDARISALVAPYGAKKVVFLPKKSAAIIEFHSSEDSGKASLALQGYEIMPGHKLTVGDKWDVETAKGEHFESGGFEKKDKAQAKEKMMPVLSRPVQRGGRGRGGLGFKRGGAVFAGSATKGGAAKGDTAAPKKSNSDFRALFLKKDDDEGAGEKKGDGDAMLE